MEYRFEEIGMGKNLRIAIPAHYTEEDVKVWKNKLGARMDRVFEEIWPKLSDEEKIRINEAHI